MIMENRNPRIPLILFVTLAALILFTGEVTGSKQYDYQQTDKAAEQKKFLAKLSDDNKKVDMAIENTKTLIDRSRGRSYLPELYLRLAELYIEKSRIVYFIRKSQVSDSLDALKQIESKNLKNSAIEVYQRILDDFPKFEARDKIHFFMAHEYREIGRIDDMVKSYRIIIKQFKRSKYIPECYLLLGDYFNNQGDLQTATKHYKAVLNYPESPAVPIAMYKLAWCHINHKEHKKAIALFEKCVTAASSEEVDIDTYKRVDIKQEAFIDMAYCYPECYKENPPDEAISYFKKFAWSRPVYTMVLEKLAYRYYIKKKWHHAAIIYRQLSELQHDADKLLEYAGNTFECVQELGDFNEADKDMGHIIKALRKQRYSVHYSREEKEKNLTDYELYARNIVTLLHDNARKEKSVESFKRASDSYKLYLGFFDQSPVYEDMESNYAEALFSSNQFLEAGKVYEKIAAGKTKLAMHTQEALYSTVISYYSALKKKEDLNYYQVAFARDGLRKSGTLYAKHFPKSKQVPDVLFNVAWISYDEGKYDQAIAEFIDFINQYPSGKSAKAAIHLTLDAYHLKEDYEGLIKFGKDIIANHRIKDNKFIADVSQMVNASESKIVSSLTVAAVNNWEKGRSDLSEFAELNKDSGLGEQALTALLVSGKEKNDIDTVYTAGSKLIAQYPNSTNTENTLSLMIDTFSKASQYRMLATYLEKFAAKYPQHKNAKEFYSEAGHIREILGQYDLSNRNYQKYLNLNNGNSPLQEEMVFSMANNAEKSKKSHDAVKVLTKYRNTLSKVGKIKADARIADLSLQNGNPKTASTYRKRAHKAYTPLLGKKDESLKSAVAGMAFNAVDRRFNKYMDISLTSGIDNKIVDRKSKLLESLEKGYHDVIQYASPRWALKACYRSFEINKEFAGFLKNAPLPDLPPDQKQQYTQILAKKVQGYLDKADQYRNACAAQAQKWVTCDPELAAYFLNRFGSQNLPYETNSFSKNTSSKEFSEDFLANEPLERLHTQLMKEPSNLDTIMELAHTYIGLGDIKHAILLAKKILEDAKPERKTLRAKAYNTLGLAYLYDHNDTNAKYALEQSLKIEPNHINAKINLAGLYQYYGHVEKAGKIYGTFPLNSVASTNKTLIHPRAWELYDDKTKLAENRN